MKPIKISSRIVFIFLFLLVFTKAIVYAMATFEWLNFNLGGGNDSDYYNDYALGYEDSASSIWPELLYKLNSIGLYDRRLISMLLFFMNVFFIPWLVVKNSSVNRLDFKLIGLIFIVVNLYPTLFYYTFDIYRDVFMVFVFLLGLWGVKCFISAKRCFSKILLLLIVGGIGFFLLKLRIYLGFSFLISLLFFNLNLRSKKSILFFLLLYVSATFILNFLGFFEPLVKYREIFDSDLEGSTLGIDLSDPVMFIPNMLLSAGTQVLGLYFPNFYAVILFLLETLPFVLFIVFVVRNIAYVDKFMTYMIFFFVIYLTIWSIGNDNLGTALRLRFFNYIIVCVCFFYVWVRKSIVSKG